MNPLAISVTTARNIPLQVGEVEAQFLVDVANDINSRLRHAQADSDDPVDLFEVIDLRMLSGLVGELYASELSSSERRLLKNPNLDGYPDLCDMSNITHVSDDLADYLHHDAGGIEIKNTFGVKKAGVAIPPRRTRSGSINRMLVWKAHHQFTNNLLALQSDYVDGIPQIVRGFFSGDLIEADWTVKANPSSGSTMTSFCQTKKSAFEKLKLGEVFQMGGYGHV